MQSICVLVELDWAEPMMYLLCTPHVHAFSMHMYFFSHILTFVSCFGTFLIVSFFLPLLLVTLVVSMAPNVNPLRPRILFVLVPLPLLIMYLSLSSSVKMMPTRHFRRTCPDEAFIQSAESFWVILLTPTFPLSFTVGNGSLFVMSPSLFLSC